MGEFPIRSALQKWRDMGEIAETLSEPWGVAGGSGSLIDVCGEKSEIGVEIYIYVQTNESHEQQQWNRRVGAAQF